ncbi:MAG: efflux RND transporter periplasmic adaptor subunit [Desulfobacterales bacterium]|nr:efflux RND transporter periplasmic adaptor subunit [Desulfobacterales bacterium]
MKNRIVSRDVEHKADFFIGFWCLMMVMLWSGCSGDAPPAAGAKRPAAAMPVTVADVVEQTVPIALEAVGQAEAYTTVTIKAQVEGELIAVHLREGQCVRAGDALFNIDARPFEAQLKQMQANLAKDKALLENARAVRQRAASLVDKGNVSRERYDQSVADVAAFEATVQADEAAVEKARLQLAYCAIRAPIDGCAGEVFVDRGNLVKANDAEHPLVVIRQIDPILVAFSVPERHLPEVKKYAAKGKLVVRAAMAGREDAAVEGQLTFVDNSVNAGTGTILLKATFANGNQALWPGQFVDVSLQLAAQPNAVVVPSQAVQTGQNGPYVYSLKADQTVELRSVRVDRAAGGWTVIAEGVRPGDKVVTGGQLRLVPGATVKIVAGVQDRKGAPQP